MNKTRIAFASLAILASLTLTACGNESTPTAPTPAVTSTPSPTATTAPETPAVTGPADGVKVTLTNGTAEYKGVTITCPADSPSAIVYADAAPSCEEPVSEEMDDLLDGMENAEG
jgi:hypothetical protein